MIKGKTNSGFEYEIDDGTLNNYELIEILAEIEEQPLLLPKLIKMILGEKQKNALMEHIRDANGTVPVNLVNDELTQIIQSQKKLKN